MRHMRNLVNTQRLSTVVVLLAALVLMSVACSFATLRSDTAAAPAATVAASTETADMLGSTVSTSEESQASHPCGVPQSQLSVTSSPLLDSLALLPLLTLFDPPTPVPSVGPVHEDLDVRHGEGLLTRLCVQRV